SLHPVPRRAGTVLHGRSSPVGGDSRQPLKGDGATPRERRSFDHVACVRDALPEGESQMKSFKGAVVAVAAIALAAAAQAGAGGACTVSAAYTVDGLSVPGVTTGLVLRQGQVVTVTASGAVCPFGDAYCPGPDGNSAVDTTTVFLGGFPLPGAPAWGLVGRVGNGPWVQIGSGPKVLSGTGELVFAVNDDV